MVSLTDEQVASYREDGYVLVEDAFDEAAVERMQAESDRLLELAVNSSRANDRESGRLDVVEDGDGGQMVRKLQPVDDLSLLWTEIEEEVREGVEDIYDETADLLEEKLNYKQPLPDAVEWLEAQGTSAFPVHNDWAYYQSQGYPQSTLSAAVLVDDATAEKGPLHVWPGTHDRHREHERVEGLGLQVPADEVPGEGHDLLADAGSVVFFSSLLVHSSRPNTSEKPRRLMIYSHYPESDGEDIAFDERNGPTRFHEQPHEHAYLRKRAAGEAEAPFDAP